MIGDLQQWQSQHRPISWPTGKSIYIDRPAQRSDWLRVISLTLLKWTEKAYYEKKMAYLIPAHLCLRPQTSCTALGHPPLPTRGQSNFGHLHFLWKVQAGKREKRESEGGWWLVGRVRLVIIRSTWSENVNSESPHHSRRLAQATW